MKKCIWFLVMLSNIVIVQKDLQFIKLKNEDRTVDLSVINHTENDYKIIVKVEMVNMSSPIKFPLELTVLASEKVKIGTLTPISDDPTHYLISYKVEDVAATKMMYEPNLTIYTKNKDRRSTQLLIYLNQNGIAYNEINTSYNGDTKEMYAAMLKRRGLDIKDAKIPVVIFRGDVFYDIKNVKKFCKQHLAEEGHFIKKNERRY